MNAPAKTFGSPSGEPSITRSMLQQMCEKLWTLPSASNFRAWIALRAAHLKDGVEVCEFSTNVPVKREVLLVVKVGNCLKRT